MKRDYFIFTNGRLKRKDNTLFFIDEEENKKAIPVETIRNLYVFGELDFNSKFFVFLAQNEVLLHIFNYYGFYSGSFVPRKTLLSGELIVNQVKCFTNKKKQIFLAKETVSAAMANIRRNLLYYNTRGKDLQVAIEEIEGFSGALESCSSIEEIMGVEGLTRRKYYETFNTIINNPDIEFTERVRQPPDNAINTLISFGNMLLYTTVLSEIFKTQLDPTVSFLHKPGYRRYSLALDIAEIFKPILVDRIIFKTLNRNMIAEKDFSKELNHCYLKEPARKIFVREYDQQLQTTIKHRTLDRHVSYRHLIRLECYKLIKYIIENKAYDAFRIWW
jgi:CRISPR-associated protein Cas1